MTSKADLEVRHNNTKECEFFYVRYGADDIYSHLNIYVQRCYYVDDIAFEFIAMRCGIY